MYLNGSDTDGQPTGDVTVGIPLRHQFQNFFLSRCEPVRPFVARWCRLGEFDRFPLLGRGRGLGDLCELSGLRSFA